MISMELFHQKYNKIISLPFNLFHVVDVDLCSISTSLHSSLFFNFKIKKIYHNQWKNSLDLWSTTQKYQESKTEKIIINPYYHGKQNSIILYLWNQIVSSFHLISREHFSSSKEFSSILSILFMFVIFPTY